MQLRVARLCLDCEELYVGDHCPVCASEHYAFLSTWLPSEERRRWRRPGRKSGSQKPGLFDALKRFLRRAFGEDELEPASRTLRTRAEDHVPNLNFDPQGKEPQKPSAHAQDSVELSPPQV